jgi:hypothetical protein
VSVKQGAQKEDFILDSRKRAEAVRAQLKVRQDAGDRALEHIHEVGYDFPEECLMAMSDEIPCLTQNFYAVYMNTRDFFAQVGRRAVEDTYRRYRCVLQLLAYQHGDFKAQRRWMLKSPIHLFYIKELAVAFPDATIIWYELANSSVSLSPLPLSHRLPLVSLTRALYRAHIVFA